MLKKIFGLGSDEETAENQEEAEVEEKVEEEAEEKKSLFGRLKEGLSKTREGFVSQLESLFRSYDKINEDLYEELEEVLIKADVGVTTTMKLVEDIKEKAREEKIKDPNKLINILQDDILEMLNQPSEDDEQPTILMVVGVNGAGKTTT
ncbi:MAG: signal recognition particle receptor subunit alpha, partial [Bacillota bacterium]